MSRIAVWPELKSIADSLACFYETKYTGTNKTLQSMAIIILIFLLLFAFIFCALAGGNKDKEV